MLVTQQLLPALGYSLELPIGWTVIVDTTSGSLRAFLAGAVSHREAGCSVELGDADFSLSAISLDTTLEEYAEARMKRHVPQGYPERFAAVVGDRAALGYTWTDGISDIATWFVEPLPSVVVRVDHSIPSIAGQHDRESTHGAREQVCSRRCNGGCTPTKCRSDATKA